MSRLTPEDFTVAEQLAADEVADFNLADAKAVIGALVEEWQPGEPLLLTPAQAAGLFAAVTTYGEAVGALHEALVVAHIWRINERRKAAAPPLPPAAQVAAA